MENLNQALQEHKNNNYELGMYEDDTAINQAFFDKKIFIFQRKMSSKTLVIGREGLLFKKAGFLKWTEIGGMRANKRYVQKVGTIMVVKLFAINGKKYNFSSKTFKRKEFPKKGYPDLFYKVFAIYAKSALQAMLNP